MKPQASSEEIRFLDARQDKLPISKVSEALVREALRYCMVKVGLRGQNFPEGAEKILLLNHVIGFYGNHTADEIRLAFDMALSAKLGLDIQDVKCYENFSCAYFSTIMNAYRVWASQVSHQKEKEEKIEPKVYTEEEKKQIDKEYEEFLKTPLARKLGKSK